MLADRVVRFLEMVETVALVVSAEPAAREVMQPTAKMAWMQPRLRPQPLAEMAVPEAMERTVEMVEMAGQAAWPWVPALQELMALAVMAAMGDQLEHPVTVVQAEMGRLHPRQQIVMVQMAALAAIPDRLGLAESPESEPEARQTALLVQMVFPLQAVEMAGMEAMEPMALRATAGMVEPEVMQVHMAMAEMEATVAVRLAQIQLLQGEAVAGMAALPVHWVELPGRGAMAAMRFP